MQLPMHQSYPPPHQMENHQQICEALAVDHHCLQEFNKGLKGKEKRKGNNVIK